MVIGFPQVRVSFHSLWLLDASSSSRIANDLRSPISQVERPAYMMWFPLLSCFLALKFQL